MNDDLMNIRSLELWRQGCQVGLTCSNPEEAEKLYSIFKSCLELGMPIMFRDPRYDVQSVNVQ